MTDKPDTWERTAHVRYAYSPRQGANSRGGYHLVLNAPLSSGRLHRDAGDVLCQPNRDFWGLEPRPEVSADCTACVRLAERHNITTVRTRRTTVHRPKSATKGTSMTTSQQGAKGTEPVPGTLVDPWTWLRRTPVKPLKPAKK